MTTQKQSRQVVMQRIKRQASEFGLTLVGSRSTIKTSPQYGKLILVDATTGRVVMLPEETGVYWRSLEEIDAIVEELLTKGQSPQLECGVTQ